MSLFVWRRNTVEDEKRDYIKNLFFLSFDNCVFSRSSLVQVTTCHNTFCQQVPASKFEPIHVKLFLVNPTAIC